MHSRSQIEDAESRILAVHSGALGDCILFAHLLRRLRGDLTLLAGGAKSNLLAGAGVVSRALNFHVLPMHEVFSEAPLSACRLPKLLGPHGRLISCFATGDRTEELRLAAMCGAERSTFLPIRPPDDATGHLLDLWAEMLHLPAFGPADFTAWPTPRHWRDAAKQALAGLGTERASKYFVLHPGAGGEAKCWPVERFVELGERLGNAVCVLGPAETDRWPVERVRLIEDSFPTLISPPLETLAGVLSAAAASVGNDSGLAHLSAAVGCPTVTLFGPTRPEHFAPVGPAVRVLAAGALEAIPVGKVLRAVSDLV